MRRFSLILFLSAAICALTVNTASARDWGRQGKAHGLSLEHKVYKKVMMIKHRQDELKFSDEDVQKAYDLKTALKKDLIKLETDLDIVALDIDKAMRAKTPDAQAISKLIDEKYEIKKKKAKRALEAYIAVKAMFSEEQRAKLRSLYKQKKFGNKAPGRRSSGK